MNIRNYRAGDEAIQAEIYNEATADLPKAKPATAAEVAKRFQAEEFDPATHFYAEDGGRVVGYACYHANGRISFPWTRKGQQAAAGPLLQKVFQEMKAKRMHLAFAAYRGDWLPIQEYLVHNGFKIAREMVNFSLDLVEMPTRSATPSAIISTLTPADIPVILELAPEVLRIETAVELENYLFRNPSFPSDAVMVVRGRKHGEPVATGILVQNRSYANPNEVDSGMPCFRLGAFGTEGMQTKRINGLFSYIARNDSEAMSLGLGLLEHAAFRMEQTDASTLAAQVPSDAPHLLRFYRQQFRRQGSFPIFEKTL